MGVCSLGVHMSSATGVHRLAILCPAGAEIWPAIKGRDLVTIWACRTSGKDIMVIIRQADMLSSSSEPSHTATASAGGQCCAGEGQTHPEKAEYCRGWVACGAPALVAQSHCSCLRAGARAIQAATRLCAPSLRRTDSSDTCGGGSSWWVSLPAAAGQLTGSAVGAHMHMWDAWCCSAEPSLGTSMCRLSATSLSWCRLIGWGEEQPYAGANRPDQPC